MFTSSEQISPPSLVLNCKVAKFCIKECPKAVNLKRISTQKECKCKEFSLQTRLGGEICSSDVIMHKGHSHLTPLRAKYAKCRRTPTNYPIQFVLLFLSSERHFGTLMVKHLLNPITTKKMANLQNPK